MGWDDSIRTRLEALILGTYGNEFTIPEGLFQLADKGRTLETTDPGSIERRVQIEIPPVRTPVLPVDRMSGFGHYEYAVNIRVGYALTNAGGDEPEVTGPQSGSGLASSVDDRANTDRNRIEAALGSFRNTGGLTPHVIDLRPSESSGTLERGESRAILTVPFRLWVRVPLATT